VKLFTPFVTISVSFLQCGPFLSTILKVLVVQENCIQVAQKVSHYKIIQKTY